MNTLLVLCTGNYYRSRFVEHWFNHLVIGRKLSWVAVSRGLAVWKGFDNVGPMKAWAVRHLRELGVSIKMNEQRMPLQLEEQDFTDAALILGVHERNHRPLLLDQFPALAEQSNVRFWNVPDVEELSPIEALPMLESMTRTLIDELESGLK